MTALAKTFKSLGIGTSQLSYSSTHNIVVANTYTSNAGNTYCKGLRWSQDIIIVEDIGHGHTLSFLNGIKVYTKDKILISEERYHRLRYSKETVKEIAKEMVMEACRDAARRNNVYLNESNLEREAQKSIGAVMNFSLSEREQLLLGG